MKTYIICSTQRSGSTLFCETLSQTNEFGKPTEKLLYYERKIETLKGLDALLFRKTLKDSLAVIMKERNTNNTVSGIKIMMSTVEAILRKDNKTILQSQKFYSTLNEGYNNPLFIFWKRSNKIKQAISHAYLKKTRIPHAKTDKEIKELQKVKKNIKLNMNEIYEELIKIFKDELKWKLFFATNNIQPIVITFEDFLSDKTKILNLLASKLNINYDAEKLSQLELPLKKVSSDSQKQIEYEFSQYLKKFYTSKLLLEYDFDIDRFYK